MTMTSLRRIASCFIEHSCILDLSDGLLMVRYSQHFEGQEYYIDDVLGASYREAHFDHIFPTVSWIGLFQKMHTFIHSTKYLGMT